MEAMTCRGSSFVSCLLPWCSPAGSSGVCIVLRTNWVCITWRFSCAKSLSAGVSMGPHSTQPSLWSASRTTSPYGSGFRPAHGAVPVTHGHTFLWPPATSTQHFCPSLQQGTVIATGCPVRQGLCQPAFSLPAPLSPAMNQDSLWQCKLLSAVACVTVSGAIAAW